MFSQTICSWNLTLEFSIAKRIIAFDMAAISWTKSFSSSFVCNLFLKTWTFKYLWWNYSLGNWSGKWEDNSMSYTLALTCLMPHPEVLQCSSSHCFWYCCHFMINKIFYFISCVQPMFKDFRFQASSEKVITRE